MRILVVNDDGIGADGLRHLVQMAKELGEVWVVAPNQQCSAMSHRITVHGTIDVIKKDYLIDGVHAYAVGGTPADCVKIGIQHLLPQKPDIIFSGINYGYNIGLDILYSGTVGAAMEAIVSGIPSIAFSKEMNDNYDVADAYLLSITKELLSRGIQKNQIWNVNFPGCNMSELRGFKEDCIPAQEQFYLDHYERIELEKEDFRLKACGVRNENAEEGTDMKAVLENYISIGKVSNHILR